MNADDTDYHRLERDILAACMDILLTEAPEEVEHVIAAQLLCERWTRSETRARHTAHLLRIQADITRSETFCCCGFVGLDTNEPQCDVIISNGGCTVRLWGGFDKDADEAYVLSPEGEVQARLPRANEALAEAVREQQARLE
jgi:hypothetical protein